MTRRRLLWAIVLALLAGQWAFAAARFAGIGDRLDRIEAGLTRIEQKLAL